MMKRRWGRIINIASVVGLVGNKGQANYAASKAGLIGLTKSVAKEYASRNILANGVAPGFIETDMTAAMTDEAKKTLFTQIPLGRLGNPEDIASIVDVSRVRPGGVYHRPGIRRRRRHGDVTASDKPCRCHTRLDTQITFTVERNVSHGRQRSEGQGHHREGARCRA